MKSKLKKWQQDVALVGNIKHDYLQEGDKFTIDRLQFNSFANPYKNIYTKFSAGIFERMFGGYGGEFLYRPFEKNYGIGFEAWRVRQRDYKQNLTFAFVKNRALKCLFYKPNPT